MPAREGFLRGLVIGLGVGAWVFPVGQLIAARISGRHFLSIQFEEK